MHFLKYNTQHILQRSAVIQGNSILIKFQNTGHSFANVMIVGVWVVFF